MNKTEIKTNRALLAEFNAAYAAATVQSVCAKVYPAIGNNRAVFYRNTNASGGWLIATEPVNAATNRDIAVKVNDIWINKADALEYDPYNNAEYAMALLDLSNAVRGIDHGPDESC